ncbi:MAG TPA: von Willebrand factor type A domain-containing protein [Thermoanaerobaculia bacterium]|nr:von Willebrand factor type A domain-containing protein [Thermoanaerobaculia bacterium]
MKRVVVLLSFFTFALCALASLNCVLRGVISDGSGPLPGATVIISAPGQADRTVVTDANGAFSVAGLAPGTYTVQASLEGFNTVRQQVVLQDAKTISVSLQLPMAAVAETITVTAASPRLYAASASMAYAVDGLDTARYKHFEEHGFVQARNQAVTTFAIDVDRASYANVRRMLNNGEPVPPDAVRIEEMINYFSYDYPQPDGPHPFKVISEVASCPWNPRNRLVRIGVQGRNLDQWKMQPNNLVFLLDVSGSMEGDDRIELVKKGMRVLVDQLRAEDRVAIVVYAGAAGLVLPSTSGANKEAILAALENLKAGGSTAGGAGIELAYKVAKEAFLEKGNNRVILATDGDFNVGTTDEEALQKLIEEKRKSGIYLSCLGVGDDNYNDSLMETLADKGNGNYSYLDSFREAKKVFEQELTGTLVTIAKDVKIQIEFDPEKVVSYRQLGYENRALANEDFDDDTKDAGELGAGHSVTALYEIEPRGLARSTIAFVRLRYKEPNAQRSTMLSERIVDVGTSANEATRDFQFAAAIAEMGMLLRKSQHSGSASWDDALAMAKIARGEDLDGTRAELVSLIEKAKN